MDWLISFILSVAASVVAYYICKWMDLVAILRFDLPAPKR